MPIRLDVVIRIMFVYNFTISCTKMIHIVFILFLRIVKNKGQFDIRMIT